MAGRPRVHFPGALDHVISRGNQRPKVYRDEQDYRRFETLLGEMGKGGVGARHDICHSALDLLTVPHHGPPSEN
jgi:hypothetical protein